MARQASIYWDTNIFILLKEHSGREHDLLWDLLDAMRKAGTRPTTSALAISELLVGPLKNQNKDLIETYQGWLVDQPWLDVLPVNEPVLVGAALLRTNYSKYKLPDAIHLASALHVRCDYFLTADAGLDTIDQLKHPLRGKLDIHPLEVLRPDEATLIKLTGAL